MTSTPTSCSGKNTGRLGAIDLRRRRRHIVHTVRMQDAFAYVLFATVGVGIVAALIAFAMSGGAYDQIGKGGLFREDDDWKASSSGGSGPVDLVERDAEIRQMLEARNARRAAAGRETVDVEEELSRLTAPVIDDELRAEIRAHVVARNHRRVARGQEPLDVDAEVERQIRDLPV